LFNQFFELRWVGNVAPEQYQAHGRGVAQKGAFFLSDRCAPQSSNESALRHDGGLARVAPEGKRHRR
jgi:hypothetical protein